MKLTGGEIKNAIVIAIIDAARSMESLTTEMLMDAARSVVGERLVDIFKDFEKGKGGIGFEQGPEPCAVGG